MAIGQWSHLHFLHCHQDSTNLASPRKVSFQALKYLNLNTRLHGKTPGRSSKFCVKFWFERLHWYYRARIVRGSCLVGQTYIYICIHHTLITWICTDLICIHLFADICGFWWWYIMHVSLPVDQLLFTRTGSECPAWFALPVDDVWNCAVVGALESDELRQSTIGVRLRSGMNRISRSFGSVLPAWIAVDLLPNQLGSYCGVSHQLCGPPRFLQQEVKPQRSQAAKKWPDFIGKNASQNQTYQCLRKPNTKQFLHFLWPRKWILIFLNKTESRSAKPVRSSDHTITWSATSTTFISLMASNHSGFHIIHN